MPRKITATIISLLALVVFTVLPVSAASASSANFSLSPALGTFDKDTLFQVDITLDASAQGASVAIIYDVSKLQVTNLSSGVLFNFYDVKNYDNSTGKLLISANTPSTNPSSKVFGTITFKAKDLVSSTKVNFDTANTTALDSSSQSLNIQTNNAVFTIVKPLVIADTTSPTPTKSPSSLPQTGIVDELILPLTLSWLFIMSFLVTLYFKYGKNDVLSRVLSQQKK